MICDNCQTDTVEEHRCRIKEDSCIDGKECPDYIKECDCKVCKGVAA